MTSRKDRNPYPFHADNGPSMYTGEHVAAMMRARDKRAAREARERRKEIAAMLAYNVIIIGMIVVAFLYLSR